MPRKKSRYLGLVSGAVLFVCLVIYGNNCGRLLQKQATSTASRVNSTGNIGLIPVDAPYWSPLGAQWQYRAVY